MPINTQIFSGNNLKILITNLCNSTIKVYFVSLELITTVFPLYENNARSQNKIRSFPHSSFTIPTSWKSEITFFKVFNIFFKFWKKLRDKWELLLFNSAAAAKSLQLCPTLCNSTDSSPPGCPNPGILQARILEWVAISFSNAWKWKWSRSVVPDS